MNPDFTVEFNAEERRSDWSNYRRFIEGLRDELTVRYSSNVPVLPNEQNPATRWFDVVLRNNSSSIRIRIRGDNLYLVAYQMQNSNVWLELDIIEGATHQVAGSTFLGFGGSYTEMNRAAPRGESAANIELGQQALIDAVNALSHGTEMGIRARSLIILVQMICESTRFSRISNYFADNSNRHTPPPPWLDSLVHSWAFVSRVILSGDANPDYGIPPNQLGIGTRQDAINVIGILLGLNIVCNPPNVMLMNAINDGQCPLGQPLVEVFWVRITNFNREYPGSLYGKITVIDGLGSHLIYNCKREDCDDYIRPRESVSLTGPDRSFSGDDGITINVDFMAKYSSSPDDEVSHGIISWNRYEVDNVYDDPLYADVSGKYGSVTVSYIVLRNAVSATVKVVLVNGNGKNPTKVFGQVTARNSDFSNESLLIRKTSKQYTNVAPGQEIPLSKSVVAVPLYSSLIVGADLWDHNSDWSPTNDMQIAKGTVEFAAKLTGTFEKRIYGDYGEIRVKITWNN